MPLRITRWVLVLIIFPRAGPATVSVVCVAAGGATRLILSSNPSRRLNNVHVEQALQPARAVISPHAGYAYSGSAAAHAYAHMPPGVKRVFILGPSHHEYIEGCALPSVESCETPLGPLSVDTGIVQELRGTQAFQSMSLSVDEAEHSIEMQYPYIAHISRCAAKVVPILVGSVNRKQSQAYDFCHWGSRFGYTPYDEHHGAIHEFIEAMDRRGMRLLEKQDVQGFWDYLAAERNTICGRHPIGVFMCVLKAVSQQHTLRFVHYSQSSAVTVMSESSVSYASAVCK